MSPSDAPYHAHIYYSGGGRRGAADALRARFSGDPEILFVGRMMDEPVGPHPVPQFEIHFLERSLATVIAASSLQKTGGDRDTSLTIGETTIKYGLTDRSDIEVDVTPWQRATSRGPGIRESASGIGDINVIMKQELTSPDAPLQVTLYPYVKIPTAKHSLGNGKWEGGLLVPIDYAIGKSAFSIELTPEVDWVADADGHGHHAAMVQDASLGWPVHSKLNLSAEIWGQWDWDPAGTTEQYSADGSVAYLVNNNTQLDAGANFGLNR